MLQRENVEEVTSLCALGPSAPLRQKRTVRTLGFAAEGQRSKEAEFFEDPAMAVESKSSAPSNDPSERMPAHESRVASANESGEAWLTALEGSC